ncbi:MAG: antitoxin [Firmicutes bacterium]|nr:antitoxin [Bacillota bacterium]
MSTISLRVPDQELSLFKNYARIHNKSLSEVIRNTMLERIEDEYDLTVFAEYEKEKAAGKVKTYTHEEVWRELGL